jgi:hypothetical protein
LIISLKRASFHALLGSKSSIDQLIPQNIVLAGHSLGPARR